MSTKGLLVIVYNTPWGRPQYEVLGSTATYAVFPGLPSANGHPLAYCTCPAYAYTVLLSETQIMVSINAYMRYHFSSLYYE